VAPIPGAKHGHRSRSIWGADVETGHAHTISLALDDASSAVTSTPSTKTPTKLLPLNASGVPDATSVRLTSTAEKANGDTTVKFAHAGFVPGRRQPAPATCSNEVPNAHLSPLRMAVSTVKPSDGH
jgi:hypothetical protein